MGSRTAINAFCDYVNKHDRGLWYKIEETSFGYFLANSQQTNCTGKLVIHMYDKSWSVHTTEFDIGFQFFAFTKEVIPELHQTRNLETPAQDVKEPSPSYGLPRHSLVHGRSLLQDT